LVPIVTNGDLKGSFTFTFTKARRKLLRKIYERETERMEKVS
jgi:hypothetical protein